MHKKSPTVSNTGDFFSEIWDDFSEEEIIDSRDAGAFEELEPIEEQAIENGMCLDAGCGTGRRSVLLSEYDANTVISFDISGSNASLTEEIMRSHATAQNHVYQGNVLDIPHKSNRFDYILCNGVLHHTSDPTKGFRELARVLDPSGTIRIGLYHPSDWNDTIARYRRWARPIPKSLLSLYLKWRTDEKREWKMWMDSLKTPIRRLFTVDEVREWFEEEDLELCSVEGNPGYKYYVGRASQD